jgi:serine/threonine protein kinase
MSTVPADRLVGLLRDCQLLLPDQLDELVRDLQPRFPEAEPLAQELVKRTWLTSYQATQLIEGRREALVLGQYLLLELLGEGGMGRVYKARHRGLHRLVALKTIRRERLADQEAVSRFQREVRALAGLSHPNIVQAYDAESIGDTHFLVMEYVHGTDLQALVKRNGPPPAWMACVYIRQAALGVQHTFGHGIVHRDIKPSNLLLTADGSLVKILDLGLALLNRTDDQQPTTLALTRQGMGTVLGTLDYLAPEQVLDPHAVDVRADLYSLGCTLFYLLTGRVPFPGGTVLEKLFRHCYQEPTPVEQLRPGVPPELGSVVRQLMAKQPGNRYQTPAEAAEALRPFARKPHAEPGSRTPAGAGSPPFTPAVPVDLSAPQELGAEPGVTSPSCVGWFCILLTLIGGGLLLCLLLLDNKVLDAQMAGWLIPGVIALGLTMPAVGYLLFRWIGGRPLNATPPGPSTPSKPPGDRPSP